MFNFSHLPIDIGAEIASYLTQIEDVNAFRLSGKVGYKCARMGVTCIKSEKVVRASYVDLFERLENVSSVSVTSIGEMKQLGSKKFLQRAIIRLDLLISTKPILSRVQVVICVKEFVEAMLAHSTVLPAMYDVSIIGDAIYTHMRQDRLTIKTKQLGLAIFLRDTFPSHYLSIYIEGRPTLEWIDFIERCQRIITTTGFSHEVSDRLREHTNKEIKVKLRGQKFEDAMVASVSVVASQQVYLNITQTSIPVPLNMISYTMRTFPGAKSVSIISIQDDIGHISASFQVYPSLETIRVYIVKPGIGFGKQILLRQ